MPGASDDARADIALLGRVIARDGRAIGELYDRHSRLLYGLILRILRNRSEAEEVLQEVFVQVWTRADTYNVELGAPVAWLVRIARNRAIDCLRRRRPENDIEDAVVSVEHDLVSETDRSRTIEKVRGALQEMPAPQRSALEMAYFEGLTHSEIAGKTGEPLGTIKTRIRTGLLALRKVLAA